MIGSGASVEIGDGAWLHALWLAPAAFALFALSIAERRRALRRFASVELLGRLADSVSWTRRWAKAALFAGALAALAVALARPLSSPEEVEIEQRGREIVFVVDVSRSMLAQDLAPSRLERAKLWIRDLTETLGGDRIGLVAFAGAARLQCPLTFDRDFFKMTLEELDPGAAPRGGTYIGDAIRKTLADVFGPEPAGAGGRTVGRDIILITDGEDQDSFPVEAARLAGEAGVRIIAIGLGSSGDGAIVPGVEFDGQPVRSRLNAEALAEVAGATPGGAFLNVGTGRIDLSRVYRDLVASAEQGVTGTATAYRYQERFWVFLAAALGLLVVESFVGERRRARP